jgi:hypothetical protein
MSHLFPLFRNGYDSPVLSFARFKDEVKRIRMMCTLDTVVLNCSVMVMKTKTPWRRIISIKLKVARLTYKSLSVYGTRRFISVFILTGPYSKPDNFISPYHILSL